MSRHRRRVVVAIAVLFGCLVAAVLVKRYVYDAEWWQADHTTIGTAPAPLTDSGPPPGPLVATWRADDKIQPSGLPQLDQVSYGIVADQILVASTDGVELRDARTGHPRWHYRRSGWVLLGWAATGRELIGYFTAYGDHSTHLMLAFDAVTGRELWRSAAASPPVLDEDDPRWPAWAGTVVAARGPRTLVGLGSRTGRRLWTHGLPRGCTLPGVGDDAANGDQGVAVIVLDCGDHGQALALDPKTGRTRWQRRTSDAADTAVQVRSGVSEVWDGTALRLIDEHGHDLLDRAGDSVCRQICPFTVVGDRVVVADRPVGDDVWLEAVGTDGRTAWRRPTDQVDQLAAADGRVYALRPKLADPLVPAGVDVLDPGTGTGVTVPLPFAYRSGDTGRWLGAGGGLLYAAYPVPSLGELGGSRLVALRGAPGGPGPDALGGVPVRDWPDACKLLTRGDLATAFPGASATVVRQRADVGGTKLPKPVACDYELQRQSAAQVAVAVRWVAATPREAHDLLGELLSGYPDAKQLPDVGDEAYDLGSLTGEVVVRVDRVVASVTVGRDNAGAATRLARAAAARLRPPPPSLPPAPRASSLRGRHR